MRSLGPRRTSQAILRQSHALVMFVHLFCSFSRWHCSHHELACNDHPCQHRAFRPQWINYLQLVWRRNFHLLDVATSALGGTRCPSLLQSCQHDVAHGSLGCLKQLAASAAPETLLLLSRVSRHALQRRSTPEFAFPGSYALSSALALLRSEFARNMTIISRISTGYSLNISCTWVECSIERETREELSTHASETEGAVWVRAMGSSSAELVGSTSTALRACFPHRMLANCCSSRV